MNIPIKKNIRNRLAITFITLSILPVLLLGIFLLWQNLEVQFQQAKETQGKLTRLASQEVKSRIIGYETSLRSIFKINDLMGMERKRQRLLLSKLLFTSTEESMRSIYYEFVLLDNRGKELVHVSRNSVYSDADLIDRSGAEEFVKPAMSGERYYSPVFFDGRTGQSHMHLSIPIFDLQNMELKGVLIAGVDLKFMIDILKDLKTGKSGIAYFIAFDDRVVVHPNPSVVLKGTYLKVPSETGIYEGILGTKSLFASDEMKFGDQTLRIVTELPVSEAGKYAVRSLIAIFVFLLITLAGAIATGYVLIRQIIRPVESLSRIAESISRGDYSQTVKIERDDEIGTLSYGFNIMTSRLIETINTLRRQMEELRQAEDLIRQRNELMNNVVNSLTHPFYVIDVKSHTITMANTAANFGDLNEKMKCYELTHNRDTPCEGDEHPCMLKEVVSSKKPMVLEHIHFTHADKPRYYSVYGYPVFDGNGDVAQIIEYALDITDRKKLEKQFLQAQKMEAVGHLAGGIAHDFNNLLSAIIGYSELALLDLTASHPAREKIRTICDAGEKAALLTKQLLAFSRKQILEIKVVNLNSVVEKMTRILHRVIGEDIQLEINAKPSVRNVKADAGQIEQVLMNLAVNARDAMPGGGRLIIETDNVFLDEEYAVGHEGIVPGLHVMLSVTDSGTGMSHEVQENLFEPFFTTKGEKGTGLGLSTIYGIIKQHGGNISVYSEPGVGTTFRIYLPSTGEAGDEAVFEASDSSLTGTGTILVVDDEPSIRKLALDILRPLGFGLLEASDGMEALRISEATESEIDLLLTDIIMPRMNGIDLSKAIREKRPSIKVIYASGYADSAILRQDMIDERTVYLQKPITPRKLVGKLKTLLAGKEIMDGSKDR